MNKTYQPFIIQKADEIFDILKEDVVYSDFMKERLCTILTNKFINGDLSSDDPVNMIFDNEEELQSFVSEALCYEDLKHLIELGLVGYLDEGDEEGHIFFITEKGNNYVEALLLEKKI